MSFKGIVGHDHTADFLMQAIKGDKVAHAYIFTGPSGIGKASLALSFAKALNCLAGTKEIPCGSCQSCSKIDAGNHPDVHVVRSSADSAAIGIEDVRDVIRDISLKPYEGRKKIYIIDGADTLTAQAQSALLKTFEEPSPETVIILVTERTDDILPTMLSRGEVVKFFPLKKDIVRDILIKDHGIDIARAHMLSGLYPGRIGEAVKKNKDEGFFERRKQLIDSLIDRKVFETGNEKRSRSDIDADLDIMLTWFRDILVTKANPSGGVDIINVDRKEAISEEAARVDFGYLEKIIQEIIATGTYLDSNVNAKLALGVLGMEINP